MGAGRALRSTLPFWVRGKESRKNKFVAGTIYSGSDCFREPLHVLRQTARSAFPAWNGIGHQLFVSRAFLRPLIPCRIALPGVSGPAPLQFRPIQSGTRELSPGRPHGPDIPAFRRCDSGPGLRSYRAARHFFRKNGSAINFFSVSSGLFQITARSRRRPQCVQITTFHAGRYRLQISVQNVELRVGGWAVHDSDTGPVDGSSGRTS